MDSGYDYHDSLIIAHAVFASTVTFFLVPAAVITGRYLRANPLWFKIHSALNIVTTCFIIIVFSLGTRAVGFSGHGNQFTGPKSDTHHRFGLTTFILVLVQALLGFAAHYTSSGTKPPSGAAPLLNPGKSILRHIHVSYGVVLVGVLYATVYTGFHEWTDASDNGTATPLAVRIVFWIVLGLEVGIYLAGFVLERGRRHAAAEKSDALSMNEK